MRIAVVGNGSMGRRRVFHSKTLGHDVICWDIREDRRREISQKFDAKTVSSQGAFESGNYDAVFICVPPAEHIYYIRMCIEKGWHFMVENPVWHRTTGMKEIIDAVRAKGIIANVSCNMRFLGGVRRIKQLVKEKSIGEILTGIVEIGEYLPDWHPYEPYTDYYPSRKEKGGGLDAICDLDWLADIFGEVEQLTAFYDKKTSLDINTYDLIQFLVKFRSGPQLILHTDMIQSPYDRYVKFISEKGVIRWDFGNQVVKVYNRDIGSWAVYEDNEAKLEFDNAITTTWAERMYLDDSLHFFKCLNGDAKPLNTIESNSSLLAHILKAIRYE